MIFSAALPAPNTAAVLAALDIMETEPEHVENLWDNSEYMRAGLKELGYNTGHSNTPIIPVMMGDDFRVGLAWAALIEEGVYTNPVVPPASPVGLLRTSYTATHKKEHLDRALRGFKVVGERLDLIAASKEIAETP
jgi:7-keto-8-aminopelargonate synthetase-like enzyme